MKNVLWNRGLAAVVGTFMLFLGAGNAAAQPTQVLKTNYALSGGAVPSTVPAYAKPLTSRAVQGVTSARDIFSNAVDSVFGTHPTMKSEITRVAREANWLRSAGWPLYALVDRYSAGVALDDEAHCIAVAIYHEARGESLEGQLAVARVIMNRAASGKYPPTWCGTVKQPWQFSFVNPRTGRYPAVNENSAAWGKALGITRLAIANAYPTLAQDVLWYHADYVSPSWGRRLSRVNKIGTHIFYRA